MYQKLTPQERVARARARKVYRRCQNTGSGIPRWVLKVLGKDVPWDWKLRSYKPLMGARLGPASKGRVLTGEELEERKQALGAGKR